MSSGRRPRELEAFWAELARLGRLHAVERALGEVGSRPVAGVDEAGRGSFAGPVVAAAVILPDEALLIGLDDSKVVRPKDRERLFAEFGTIGALVGVGIVGADAVDGVNILEATRRAMVLAVRSLPLAPKLVLTDAVDLPELGLPVVPLVRGDSRVAAIAAASVVAKVTRDRLMDGWDDVFPWYGFRKHHGYGTREHREAIRRHGPSPIHRLTFGGVLPARAAA